MDSEKLINSFEIKKDRSPGYLWDNLFQQFVNNVIIFKFWWDPKYDIVREFIFQQNQYMGDFVNN